VSGERPLPETPGGEPRGSRALVLGARLVMLLLAAIAAAAALAIARESGRRAADDDARYVCPMHPEVTAAAPGTCPICRMDLEPLGAASAHAAAINPSAFQTYDFVRRRGFGQGVRAPAWVEEDGSVVAVLYDDEIEAWGRQDRGSFSPSAGPAAVVPVERDARPPEPWDRSTSRVRFRADPAHPPRPGDVGWVRLPATRRELEVVPRSAVLESDEGPYVLVSSAEDRLTVRPVEIGRVLGDYAIVLSGLRLQERVSVRSAALLDAERRLRREPSLEVVP
jgi:Heavy metal binding domain